MFRIRVDIVNDLNSDTLIEVCRPDTYVVVRHELPTGNPHYHAYFKYDGQMKENTLRQRFKRKFSYLKSTDYSIKNCDEQRVNEYVQYMFNTKHGNKWELISVSNFDDTVLNGLMEAAKKISTEYVDTKKHRKSKGPTIWDIAQEVEEKFNKQDEVTRISYGYGIAQSFPTEARQQQEMITVYTDIAIQTLRHHSKAFDEYLLRKVISTAMSSHANGKEILRSKMIRNFATLY